MAENKSSISDEYFDSLCDALSLVDKKTRYEYSVGKPSSLVACAPLLTHIVNAPESTLPHKILAQDPITSILYRLIKAGGRKPSIYWHALDTLVDWAFEVESNSKVNLPGTQIIDFSTSHRLRVLKNLEPWTCTPCLDTPLSVYACFLACAAALLHDLGMFMPTEQHYPDLTNREPIPDDIFRHHSRQHVVLARKIYKLNSGQYPKKIWTRLEMLRREETTLGDKVDQLIRQSAPILSFLIGFHNESISRSALLHQISLLRADLKQEEDIHNICEYDIEYLLAILRLADSSDRTFRRVKNVAQLRKSLSINTEHINNLENIRTNNALMLLSYLFIDNISTDLSDNRLQITVDLRQDDNLLFTLDDLVTFGSGTLYLEFDKSCNDFLKIIEERSKVRISFPKIRGQQDELPKVPNVLSIGSNFPNARGDVSRLLNEILIDCPSYNTWVKLYWKYKDFGLLSGGEATMVSGNKEKYCEAIKRTVVEPEQNYLRINTRRGVSNTREHIQKLYEQNPSLCRHFAECVRQSNEVFKEVYAPIHFNGTIVAVANAHFDEHSRVNVSEYATDLELSLSRHGLSLYRAIRNQLEEARFIIDEIRTDLEMAPSKSKHVRKVLDLALTDRCLSPQAGNIGELVRESIRENKRFNSHALLVSDFKQDESNYDLKKKKEPVLGMILDKNGFINMLSILFRGLARETECFIDYGFETKIPLIYITVYPTSHKMKDALTSSANQLDFHSSDVFPTDPTWIRHTLNFACEARLLAVLAGGQVRLGEHKISKRSSLYEKLGTDSAPAFRIELPKVDVIYPPLLKPRRRLS
tara:strand:+ start:1557 stop:3998 length:2442 start_codon:yes stop_codon:yes gene_type:complete